MSRKTQFFRSVSLEKLSPARINPPNRTEKEARDFQELVTFIKAGNAVPPISAVFNKEADRFLIVNGHRRSAASAAAGLDSIDVIATIPGEDENPQRVRELLFSEENKAKKFTNKEYFFVALESKGRILMSSSVKKAYALVERHFNSDTDRAWLKENGTPQLLEIAQTVVNYIQSFKTSTGEVCTPQWYSMFMRKAARWMVKYTCQRATRDYVYAHLKSPTATLYKKIEKDEEYGILSNRTKKVVEELVAA